MARLVQLATAALGCLALSGTALAQSSLSTTATATGLPASSSGAGASGISAAAAASSSTSASSSSTGAANSTVTVEGRIPAYANSTQSALNATIQAVWSTDSARGTLTQGLTSLRDERNETIYGVVLQFNETTANLNYSATAIPWIAYVSCDSAIQTATVPLAVNTTASLANTTSTAANETAPAFNLLQQAQDLGAAAVLLFSSRAQSCTLNATLFSGNASTAANGTSPTSSQGATNLTVPIFSTGSQQVANIISQQFGNVPETHRYFNSTLLTASAGNLSSILSSATEGSPEAAVATAVTNFLLAQIVPSYDPSDSNNGVVATIGRAPSSAPATSSGRPAATGDASQNNGAGASSGASARNSQRGRSKITLAAVGFTAGAFLAGIGILL